MANTPGNDSPAADSTEQRIFDAAHEVFMQKGLDGAKMQEIADKAGINKALLHYYYRTKDKLYETVAKAVINRAVPVINNLIESDLPLEQKLTHFIDFYVDTIGRNPFIPLFVISEINKHPERFIETILPKELPKPKLFVKQVEAAVAAGQIRPISADHLLINVISLCIFPFLARPMIRLFFAYTGPEIKQFLAERKVEIKEFVFAAIKP